MAEPFATRRLDETTEVTAPDGSAVRPLAVLPGVASFAHFELAPGQVSAAVAHATVEEIWYVIGGSGEMWRSQDGRAENTALAPGICLTIPLGTSFQFRAADQGLRVVAVTTPPWPDGTDEARAARGPW
ncbi:cupin domain-containing protein [Amycolatopsis anabasis]|uniref:cupin domain-containing protein n=1 Tax=Amycolatopsis anabasis TaxID=1840409 RepID=UPI00131A6694|nr:cupin domain-containing protein [Amycolatopsis anabasis]